MIRFTLCCEKKHEFDGWFRSNADFDTQKERGLVTCPICHSPKVEKTLMAPNISTGRQQEKIALAMGEEQRMALEKLKEFARKARESADYVGERFEEARKIHFGEVDRAASMAGNAEEARQLIDDVDFMPLPVFQMTRTEPHEGPGIPPLVSHRPARCWG